MRDKIPGEDRWATLQRLGAIHGLIGQFQQLGLMQAVTGITGHTDTDTTADLFIPGLHRPGQGLFDLVDDHLDIQTRLHTFEQHHELIAADTGHGIILAHSLLQTHGHLFQQLITQGMAETVVHLLEAIEVQIQHRQLQLIAMGKTDGMFQAVLQQYAIRQTG